MDEEPWDAPLREREQWLEDQTNPPELSLTAGRPAPSPRSDDARARRPHDRRPRREARLSDPGGGPAQEGNQEAEDRARDWFVDAGLPDPFPADPLSPDCGPVPLSFCGDPPIGEPRVLDDVGRVREHSGSVRGPYRLVGDWDPCQEEFIQQVWALLQENVDLVRWAMCVAGRMYDRETRTWNPIYPNGDTACVEERILGVRDNPVELEIVFDCPEFKMRAIRGRPGSGKVLICGDEDSNGGIAFDMYCDNHNERPAHRMCALLAIASSLLHELTHLCGFDHKKDEQGKVISCSFPYLTGAYFAWAMMQRYPQASKSPCCLPWIDDSGDPGDPDSYPSSRRLPTLSRECVRGGPLRRPDRRGPGPDAPPDGWDPPIGLPDPNLVGGGDA